MNLTAFAQQLEDGDLFRNVTPAQKGLVRLVRTSVLQDWLSSVDRRKGIAWQLDSVLPLLLERHVLSLAVREEPEPLKKFWKSACDFSYAPESCHRLWDGGLLPETLGGGVTDLRQIAAQEARFTRVLAEASRTIHGVGELKWASDRLDSLVARRGGVPRDADQPVKQAHSRVVFAWEPDELKQIPGGKWLRDGLLVDFELLAEAEAGANAIVIAPRIFDGNTFLDAIDEGVRNHVVSSELRRLRHDCDFLEDDVGVLKGTSGTMAIWLAQFLAGGGLTEYRCTLPPWVVVTATLDQRGSGTGRAAGTVGRVREKAALLIEEGVRVMVVATDHDDTDLLRTEWDLDSLPGASGLHLLPVRAGRDQVKDIADKLKSNGLLWPVNLADFGGRATFVTPEEDKQLITERHEQAQRPIIVPAAESAATPEFSSAREDSYSRQMKEHERDYVRPGFALEAIEAGRQQLPGRGYLHVTAPAMWGKSFLIQALRHGWKRDESV